jgi:low temperature requirement protein LtrA
MSVARPDEVIAAADDAAETERRTSYLELFFDLVFVFAITEVTTLILDKDGGFVRAALILGLIWWAWSTYAWLTNAIDVEQTAVRIAVLAAAAASFFMAISVPQAFGATGIWFALTYFVVRSLMLVLYLLGARDDPARRAAMARLAPWFVAGPLLVVVGGLLDEPARSLLWTASLAVDVFGTFRAASAGWRVSPSHFAERYSLFIIIALGESMVAIGATAAGASFAPLLVTAVAVSVAGAMTLWWAYFDFAARGMERALRRAQGQARSDLARDLFTILHYPIVLGIILYAVAAKVTVAHPSEPLSVTGLVALAAGVAAFLLGSVAVRWRGIHVVAVERLVAAIVIPTGLIVVRGLPSVTLMAVAVGAIALALVIETARLRAFRDVIRADRPG